MPDDAAVAGNAQRTASASLGAGLLCLGAITLTALLYLAAASLLALVLVRVGADLVMGIDPLAGEAQRPRQTPEAFAARELAFDALRQAVLAILVLACVRLRDGPAWRRTLALGPPAEPSRRGVSARRLLAILLVWPFLHIAWVTGTAEIFHGSFGHNVAFSRALSPAGVAVWLGYAVLLAPLAEELLMRGEIFARSRAFLPPSGAILVTAALFSRAHVSLAHADAAGFVRPLSLLPLAIMLGWLRWRTGRLWPCIVLHGWSNLAVLAYLLWPARV